MLYADAPHSPATPAPWYAHGTRCDGASSPRTPAFNYKGKGFTSCTALPPSGKPPFGDEPVWWWNATEFHELVSCQPYFDQNDEKTIDALAAKRCKALMSVDDAYAGILDALERLAVANETYVLVTSDHGYNLGQHMLPSNKFLNYEHSLRIPMVIRGPGIAAGTTSHFLGTQVDLAPTILGLAGIAAPGIYDGKSIVPLIIKDEPGVAMEVTIPGSVRTHLRVAATPERDHSYHCYVNQGPWEVGSRHPLDDWSNTYLAITYKGPLGYYKYAKFDPYGKQTNFTRPYMFELFDLEDDPFELHNIYNATKRSKPQVVTTLDKYAMDGWACRGASCP